MLACRMCGESYATVFVDGPGTWHCYEPSLGATFPYKVSVCGICGHVFGSWEEDRTHLYADQEYVTCADDLEMYSAYVAFVLAGVPQRNRRPRVLEIGFNQGALLRRFHELGFECFGIEAGSRNVEAARNRMPGAQLEVGMFGEAWADRFAPGFFDVVIATSVLEHMTAPGEVLRSIRRLLAEEGRLFIVVPDLAAYAPTRHIVGDARDRYGCSQFSFFYRDIFLCYAQHINHFSGPSLARYVSAFGLQAVQVANLQSLWISAAPAEPGDASFNYPDLVDMHTEMMRWYEQVLVDLRRSVMERLGGRKVVAYGAGRDFGYFLDVFEPMGLDVAAVADDEVDGVDVHGVRCVGPGDLSDFSPEVCLATSLDFGGEIAVKARTLFPKSVEVLSLAELLSVPEVALPRWTERLFQSDTCAGSGHCVLEGAAV